MTADIPWQQLRTAFLDYWTRLTAGMSSFAGPAEDAGTAAGQAPWSPLLQFGRLLGAYADLLGETRKRPLPTGLALQRLLEDFLLGLKQLLAASETAARHPLPEPVEWPAFGPTREWQLRLAAVWRAQWQERVATQALQVEHWRALKTGVERFLESLQHEDGPALTSLLAIFNAFVEHLEAAHAEHARSEDYLRAFGARANAGLKLRDALAAQARYTLPLAGLPGREELMALSRRLAALEEKAESVAALSPVQSVAMTAVSPAHEEVATAVTEPAAPPQRVKRASRVRPAAAPAAVPASSSAPRKPRRERSGKAPAIVNRPAASSAPQKPHSQRPGKSPPAVKPSAARAKAASPPVPRKKTAASVPAPAPRRDAATVEREAPRARPASRPKRSRADFDITRMITPRGAS